MRTALTYVLAALAASVVANATRAVLTGGDTYGPGRPATIEEAIIAWPMAVIGVALMLAPVFGLVWAALRALIRVSIGDARGVSLLVVGAAMFLVVQAVGTTISLFISASADEVLSSGALLRNSLLSIPTPLLAGLAWGGVFWLRAARPHARAAAE